MLKISDIKTIGGVQYRSTLGGCPMCAFEQYCLIFSDCQAKHGCNYNSKFIKVETKMSKKFIVPSNLLPAANELKANWTAVGGLTKEKVSVIELALKQGVCCITDINGRKEPYTGGCHAGFIYTIQDGIEIVTEHATPQIPQWVDASYTICDVIQHADMFTVVYPVGAAADVRLLGAPICRGWVWYGFIYEGVNQFRTESAVYLDEYRQVVHDSDSSLLCQVVYPIATAWRPV